MKKGMKLLALVLTLITLVSVLPMAALADTTTGGGTGGQPAGSSAGTATPQPKTSKVTVIAYCYELDSAIDWYTMTIDEPTCFGAHTFGAYINYGGKIYEHCAGGGTITPDGNEYRVVLGYTLHYHNYAKGHDRDYHWEACRCGSTLYFDPHEDPLKVKDSTCSCGYKFSDNADLTYLWMNDMNNQPFFKPDITEYQCTAYEYLKGPNVAYSYQAYDYKATVTEPKDKTLREGMNVYEFTVTAEDKKTTKTYTVYASKPSKLGYVTVYSTGNQADGFTTRLEPHVIYLNNTATLTLEAGLGERMAYQASNAKSSQVTVEPVMSRWGVDIFYINMPAEIAKQMATTDSDLVFRTYFGNIVLEKAQLEKLSEAGENIKFTLSKDGGNSVLAITADDQEVKDVNVNLTSADRP